MNRKMIFVVAVTLLGALPAARAGAPPEKKASAPADATSVAMSEKEKALASPYPNDLGPERLADEVLKAYPEAISNGYHILIGEKKVDGKWVDGKGKSGCVQCHTAARPLNSRFVEPEGGTDEAKQAAALAAMTKANPEITKDLSIWQPEVKIWNRYVKRMMNKPGCSIDKAEGKAIWEFLEYDGAHRKVGANAATWAAHRKDLIEQFKTKYPKRYAELKEAKDL